jgi:hypothetical protein
MATAYSTRFILGTGASFSHVYTVPAGHRAVLRDLSATGYSGDNAAIALLVTGTTIAYHVFPAQYSFYQWEGRIVAYAGEPVQLSSAGASVVAVLSGYLFADLGGGRRASGLPVLGEPVIPPGIG